MPEFPPPLPLPLLTPAMRASDEIDIKKHSTWLLYSSVTYYQINENVKCQSLEGVGSRTSQMGKSTISGETQTAGQSRMAEQSPEVG